MIKLGNVLGFLIVLIIGYLLCSFIGASFNPIKWSSWIRGILVFIFVIDSIKLTAKL